jgi:alpha-tubulin suppressor-like RCC1 family protein
MNRNRPVTVPGISTAVDVEAGAEFSVAVLADGSVRTWGRSNSGQLGLGNTQTHTTPAAVTGLPAIAEVGCGRAHVLAITKTGDLWGWGLDNYGQLGDRAGSARLRPVQVAGISGVKGAHGGYGYSVILRPAA